MRQPAKNSLPAEINKSVKTFAGRLDFLQNGLALGLTLLVVAWVADLPRLLFGVALLTQEFTLSILGLCLAISYFKIDNLPRRMQPISFVIGVISLVTFLFAASRYRILSEEMFYHPGEAFTLGLIMVPVVLLALFRLVGAMLFGIVVCFIAYGLFGDMLPPPFTARPWTLMDLLPHLALDSTSMVGVPLTIGVTVVIPFIVFGSVLFANGGGQFFTDIAISLMGGFRGGAAKIAVISSALFGMISGSAVSNVASTGVISIPMMKQAGLKARIAAATEAVASTGGQFMPPVMGAAAFLMSELSRVPYPTIAIAAFLPAFFFFFAVFLQSDADAIRYNVKAVPESDRLPSSKVCKDGWHFIIPFVVLIGLMFGANYSPQFAVLNASLATIFLGVWRGYRDTPLHLGRLILALRKAGETSIEIIVIVAAAGFVIGILNATGLVFNLTLIIVELAGGKLVALLIMAALISVVLGMGMPTMAVYVLLAALVVPSLIEAGVPVLSAHMFVLYFGMMSMITPPIAIASFAAASLAGERPLTVALVSMRYAWLAYLIPFIFVFRPDFLIGIEGHSWVGTIELFLATTILIFNANAALSGALVGKIDGLIRSVLSVNSVAIFYVMIMMDDRVLAYLTSLVVFALCLFKSYRSRA